MEKISAVILSGGKSSRMGMPKAYLKIGGRYFADHLAMQLSPADEILFSVACEEDYPDIQLPHIGDIYPGAGPLAGIHSSLLAARNPLLFVTACDTPLISWETVKILLSRYREGADAVLPVDQEGRYQMTCGLYHRRLIPLLENMLKKGDLRLSHILGSCSHVDVPVSAFGRHEIVFANINSSEQYRRFLHDSDHFVHCLLGDGKNHIYGKDRSGTEKEGDQGGCGQT